MADQSAAVTRDDALAFADEAFRNRDITFSHRDVVDMTGALSTFLQRHRLGATAIASAEQSAATPWFAWPARKTWEEVRVRLRSRDGNEWEEIASDFEYWMQSADGEMCDDVVAFQIIGETPLGLASVSSASAEKRQCSVCTAIVASYKGGMCCHCHELPWAVIVPTPEPVPATNQAGEVERKVLATVLTSWGHADDARAALCGAYDETEAMRQIAALATQPATSQEAVIPYGSWDVARIKTAIESKLNGVWSWLASIEGEVDDEEARSKMDLIDAALKNLADIPDTQPATLQEGNQSEIPTSSLAATPTPPTETREAELQAEIARLRGLLIDSGDPAWEDARAVLVSELRKNGMETHADNIAVSHAVPIPSWIALNLIAHARLAPTPPTLSEDLRSVAALDRAERFAKGLNTTPEEHDDIMVAVETARAALAQVKAS